MTSGVRSFSLEVLEVGEHTISAVSITSDGWGRSESVEGQQKVTLLLTEVNGLLSELDAIAKSAGTLSREIRRLHRALRHRWADVIAHASEFASLSKEERRELVADADATVAAIKREVTCQKIRVESAEEAEGPADFLCWNLEHPWMPFAPEADVPKDLISEIAISTDARGHEALAVQIASVQEGPLNVRAWLDPIADEGGETAPAGEHIELRQVTWTPTPSGGMSPDALPELGNAGILRIDRSSSARLWMDVLTRDLAPGTYTTTLHLRALTQNGTKLDVPIRWTVDSLALPEVMPVHFCNWGYGYMGKFKDNQLAALTDMQDHHTSVFPSAPSPSATYDAKGNIVAETGWEAHEEFLSHMRPQNVLLLPAFPLRPEEGAGGPFSDAWKTAFATFLPKWVKFLAERGFGYDRWAFYPVDEPGPQRRRAHLSAGGVRAVRQEPGPQGADLHRSVPRHDRGGPQARAGCPRYRPAGALRRRSGR